MSPAFVIARTHVFSRFFCGRRGDPVRTATGR